MNLRLPRNVVLLGVVSLFMDLSTEMVFPLLPALVTSLGGAGFAVGAMEGTAETVASLVKFASGRWSDLRQRRKIFALVGYGASALMKVGYAFAAAPWQILLLRSGDRLGKGIRGAPRDALIADSVARARWGFAFGFHRAFDTTGAFLAPLVAAALFAYAGFGLRGVIWIAAIPAAVSVLVLTLVSEPPRKARPPVGARAHLSHAVHSYLFTVAIFNLGSFALLFLLLRATSVGLAPTHVLLLYAAYNAAYVVLALPLGAITDRIGRIPLVVAAFLLQAAACLLTVRLAPTTLEACIPSALVFGAASAAWEGNGRALASDLSPEDARGTVLGAYHAAIGIAALPGGILAGLLWDIDWSLPFFVAAIVAAAAALEMIWMWSRGTLTRPGATT